MNKDNLFLPNQQLREARLRRGWSQQYVADQVGTTVVTVKRWERGYQSTSPYFRLKLCTLFGESAKGLGLFPEKPSRPIAEEAQVFASTESLPSATNSPDPQGITTRHNSDGINRLVVPHFPHQEFRATSPITTQQQKRTRILQRLHLSYRTLLVQSLQGSTWIDVGLSQKPDALRNTTTLLSRSASQRERLLLPGTSIAQIYEDAEQELLILGEPGTGKSTLLLHLAQQLVENALLNDAYPLPFLLPLSSWAVNRPALQNWICVQLTLIYAVPTRLAQQWVQEEHILPLLDGLDEMEEAARSACIRAINGYHCEHLNPLVVCSRTNEYTTAALSGQLRLHMAIVVQPLSAELVDTYLANVGNPLAALRTTLRENSALQAVATTPLMLQILMLTYYGTSIQSLPSKEAQLRLQLWIDYSERMINSKGDAKRYPLDITSTRLSWLARQMRKHNQTVFCLEQLQPDWLEQDASQCAYQRWAVLLPNMLVAGLLGVFASALLFSSYFSLAIIMLLFTLTGVLLTMRGNETTTWPRKTKSLHHRLELLWLLLCSSIGGLGATVISLLTHDGQGIYHMQNGLSYGGAAALLYVLLRTGNQPPEPSQCSPWSYRGMKQWFLTNEYRRDGLSIGFSCAVGFGLHELFRRGLWYALGEELRYGLLLGTTGVLLSVLIQVLHVKKVVIEPQNAMKPAKQPTWSWRKAWHYLFAWKHFKNALVIGLSVTLIMGVDFLIRGIELQQRFAWQKEGETVIGYGISIGLITLSTYWLQQWYRGGLPEELLPESTWLKPKQRSWSFAYHTPLITGISMLVGWLSYAFSYSGHANAGGDGSKYTFLFGLSAGALSGLLYGGLACLRHLLLRILLWRIHVFPWKATLFLEDATTRILLRHVGGGYSFTHRLLMDYFADLDTSLLESTAVQTKTRPVQADVRDDRKPTVTFDFRPH